MSAIFKVGDKVYDISWGWGEVYSIPEFEGYTMLVKFGVILKGYQLDGRNNKSDKVPVLSFTEYTLQGFSQERPTLFAQAYGKVKEIINKSLPKKNE